MKETYSPNEIRLFEALGYSHLVKHQMLATAIYKIAMEKMFIDGIEGRAVEALRRAIKAIAECNPYRMTPEFEELIKF